MVISLTDPSLNKTKFVFIWPEGYIDVFTCIYVITFFMSGFSHLMKRTGLPIFSWGKKIQILSLILCDTCHSINRNCNVI